MKYCPLLLLVLTALCATLAFGLLAGTMSVFIAQIFFVVFLLLFAATLEGAPA